MDYGFPGGSMKIGDHPHRFYLYHLHTSYLAICKVFFPGNSVSEGQKGVRPMFTDSEGTHTVVLNF
jgi:hypothetical protein